EKEARRWVVNRAQERREARRRARQEAKSACGKPLEIRTLVEPPREAPPALAARRPDQMRARLGREDRERELRHSRALPASDTRGLRPRALRAPIRTPRAQRSSAQPGPRGRSPARTDAGGRPRGAGAHPLPGRATAAA